MQDSCWTFLAICQGILGHDFYGTTLRELFKFSFVCGIISGIMLLIDFCVDYFGKGPSLLGIKYEKKNAPAVVILWVAGAMSVGFVGTFAGLVKNTPQSIVTIGIAWPLLFTQWVKKSGSDEGVSKDESAPEVAPSKAAETEE